MDKSSPVYENFAKKMDAMSGKPKINRQTIKFGSGMGLEQRVGNNEKKITLLKNIFKAQKQEIGEKITPKVSNLELSLNETTGILVAITDKLSMDMSQRLRDQKALFDAQRKQNLDEKKGDKENKLEEKKKTQKLGSSLAKKVVKPFTDIFDKLMNLAAILGTGILGTNLLANLENKDFVQKIKGIYEWTEKNWKALAIGAGVLGGILAIGAITSLVSSVGLVFGVLTNPVVLIALGVLGLFAIGNAINKRLDEAALKDKLYGDNTFTYLGSPIPGAPINAQPGDFFTDRNGNVWQKLSVETSNGGWKKVMIAPENLTNKQLTARTDGSETPIDLTNLYNQNLTDDATGQSLLDFVDKDFSMKTLIRERGLPVTIFQELPDIDLRTEKTNMIGELSDDTATGFPEISSINISNPYMEQTPTKFGFADIIYS